MRTLPPRPRGATAPAASPRPPALAARGTAGPGAAPGLLRRPRAAPRPDPAIARGAGLGWLDEAANRVSTLLPPEARRWLLRAAGASAGTIGLLGLVITAEALKVRSHLFLPETVYDRVLRFPNLAEDGGTPIKLAVLGDSTTTGIGTERVEETYAALVGQALATRGPVEVHVLGRAGSRLADVIAEQLPLAKSLDPDLVLLVAGANDATHVTPLADVRARIRRILDELKGRPVVLAGVPRLSLARVVAFPLRELSTYRGIRVTSVMRRCARRCQNVHFVPLSMRPTGIDGIPRAWLSTDRFHPSAFGYAQWATAFIPALLAADPRAPAPDPVPTLVHEPPTAEQLLAARPPVVVAWQALSQWLRRRRMGPAAEAAAG
jgi:lysophospholipase L1-like esterase